MRSPDRARFDVEAVRARAGAKVFARGEAYHRDGQVRILEFEARRVLAEVAGSEHYRTVLTGRGANFDGECSCPAFDDSGFCKHMVATALAANVAGSEDEVAGADLVTQIRRHLHAKGVDALVEIIVDLAERDTALFRRLELAAAVTELDGKTVERRLAKAIDDATRIRGFVDYRAAPDWASGVDAVLDTLAEVASGPQARLALKLAERALERIERAVERVDDSDGHCGALLLRASTIHLAAAQAAKPEPVALARALFARETTDGYGMFEGASTAYAEVLGAMGLAEYRRLAAEAWEKLPALHGGGRRSVVSGNYQVLANILDVFAERAGDRAARIALRAKDLSSPWQYLQLAQFCLSQGDAAEALRRAEDGLFLFEDERSDERLVFFVAELLEKAGRNADAAARLWRAFEKAPSFNLYLRLRQLGGEPVRERAIDLLQTRAAKAERTRWHYPAELLIRILQHEGMLDAAWAAVRAHGASTDTQEALARASEATHPREAIAVYAERVAALAEVGGNPAYAEAAALIRRMASLRDAGEHAAYLSEIKARFQRKRNFMALLG